ncbi:cyclohexanone monooxygenase [Lentinula edodes]|uniref:Cyclohexanone monooxygenase n=1 Tax=Lentinula edodes TaxID=5353 RepID=A0A1Q3ETL0_LENED|nr:cyclohexanone monooxygenase [Lentinula edodes]
MNQYPGVRTDSEAEIYQYELEELWKDWIWKKKYPSGDEIQAYFRYVDEKLDLKRDIYFDTRVRKNGGYFGKVNGRQAVSTSVTERVQDPALHEKLAPSIPPHPFGIKRPGLEKAYFEVFDRENVSLVDVKETPIKRVTPDGLELHSGTTHIFDVLVLATGFEGLTGAILDLDIRGSNDISIREKWKSGVCTNIGMMTSDFPNLFFVYGPQAPSPLANATSLIPQQSGWIANCIKLMQDNNYSRIETKRDAEEVWRNLVLEIASKRLCTRRTEMLAFSGGLPSYLEKYAAPSRTGSHKGTAGPIHLHCNECSSNMVW